ncbi:MAG: hypothetical protein WC208_08495 [Gallionella sp.]|jgi:hypothetical protein
MSKNINYRSLCREFDCDAFVIECNDRPIRRTSAVGISPFNTKTKNCVSGMTIVTSMEEVLKQRLPIVSSDDDKELIDFLNANYKYGVNETPLLKEGTK